MRKLKHMFLYLRNLNIADNNLYEKKISIILKFNYVLFFCRGVILFAMVNGRLPFNDAQLVEMEEEMKMQRLRFERNISFGNKDFLPSCGF